MTPLALDYGGATVHEIPPNGQGIAAQMALGMLRSFDLASMPVDSVAVQHLEIEAMKLAFADAHRYVADPRSMEVSPAALLDPDLPRVARAPDRRRGARRISAPASRRKGGTVYLCAGDASGMVVSLIQSNYMGFGSGVVVPGTGISLQNRGAGFSLEQGHPNEIDGGKRPFHTIIPGLSDPQWRAARGFRRDGRADPAARPRADARADALTYGMNPQAALDAPRWKVNGGHVARPRGRRGAGTAGGPRRARPRAEVGRRHVHGFRRRPVHRPHRATATSPASDPRRDGQAAGF